MQAAGMQSALLPGILSGFMTLIIMLIVSDIMLSVLDTIFVCWVMDCDRKQVMLPSRSTSQFTPSIVWLLELDNCDHQRFPCSWLTPMLMCFRSPG